MFQMQLFDQFTSLNKAVSWIHWDTFLSCFLTVGFNKSLAGKANPFSLCVNLINTLRSNDQRKAMDYSALLKTRDFYLAEALSQVINTNKV